MDLKAMVLSAVISLIISFPFMIYQVRSGGFKRKGDIIIEEAEAAGRIVEATLKWKRYAYGEPNHPDRRLREGTWFFAYQYAGQGTLKLSECASRTEQHMQIVESVVRLVVER